MFLETGSPDTDVAISVPGKESSTIGRPSQTNGESLEFLVGSIETVSSIIQNSEQLLVFKIPNSDRLLSGGTEPISVGAESKSVDDTFGVQAGQFLALIEVPEKGISVTATRSAERGIRRNGNSVDDTSVSEQFAGEFPLGIPNFDEFVPSSGDDHAVGLVGESNASDPCGVTILTNDIFAFSKSVP